jgi:hypothetical protein
VCRGRYEQQEEKREALQVNMHALLCRRRLSVGKSGSFNLDIWTPSLSTGATPFSLQNIHPMLRKVGISAHTYVCLSTNRLSLGMPSGAAGGVGTMWRRRSANVLLCSVEACQCHADAGGEMMKLRVSALYVQRRNPSKLRNVHLRYLRSMCPQL